MTFLLVFDTLKWLHSTTIVSNIATLIGVIVVIFAFYSFTIERKHLNLNTITRCIDLFRREYLNLDPENIELVKSYFDFVNEELFYFENNYLPKSIADEWIDGMIDFVPLFNKNGEVINNGHGDYYHIAIENKLLATYPRIKQAFTFQMNMK